MEWKHSVGPTGHDWWETTCGAWRLAVINSGPSGRWEWLVESDGEGPEPLPSWSGMSATVGEEGRIWAQAEAAHALERALASEGQRGSIDRAAIIEEMRKDVELGFIKALDRRGISASLMHSAVKDHLVALGDDLANLDAYAQYGLPLLKAVAIKYGFENPIGDDAGDEAIYSA